MVTPQGVWSKREGWETEKHGLMEFYYSLIDLLWRPEWTLCTTLSLTLIRVGRRNEGGQLVSPPLLSLLPISSISPPLLSCTSPKTRLAAVWQADAAGGHFGSLGAKTLAWQMGQLSSGDLQGEPFICVLMEGHVQHHKGVVSWGDQQSVHDSPSWPLTTNPLTPTSGTKTICKHLAWWWRMRPHPLWVWASNERKQVRGDQKLQGIYSAVKLYR